MKWFKRMVIGAVFVVVGVSALGLYYVLPRHDVVLITGVEVKRIDADGVINAENPSDGPTRDVYFINTEDPDTKKVVVYRNEDTGWGFPWYFKFDAADVQAKAQGYSRDAQQLSLIRSYGWRIQIFSVFPNITSVEPTDSRGEPFPVFNTLFFTVLTLITLVLVTVVRSLLQRRSSLARVPKDEL